MIMFRLLGLYLIQIGAKMAFNMPFNEDVERIKNTVNADIAMWSQIQTGGHSMRDIKPLSNYQIKSVISTLKTIAFIERHKEKSFKSNTTNKVSDYREEW